MKFELCEAKFLAHGLIAPSASVKRLLGIISAGSGTSLTPIPRQAGQAPKGELNEKVLGSISEILSPQLWQT